MPAGPAPLIRLCLDLNVWVAAFLGERRERRTGSSAWLVDAVRTGTCAAGPVQLVVSVGMLERLQIVLVRAFRLAPDIATVLTASIETIAAAGPAGDHPYLLLGGTGILPLRDVEDRHVLEVALAGRADVLATANLADFAGAQFAPFGNWNRAMVYQAPAALPLLIAHPDHVASWLRSGIVPSL
jgi:hypothetical protein